MSKWERRASARLVWVCIVLASIVLPGLVPAPVQGQAAGYSLRFYGHGVDDIDRAKIPVQSSASSLPTDIGAADFTIEFWLRGFQNENRGRAVVCGDNEDWIYGSIVLDRDRFSSGRKFGLSIDGAGRVVFGVTNQERAARTVCGTGNVLDGQWHHVAVQRSRADGRLSIFVDGRQDGTDAGLTGDISYPDGVDVTFQGPTYCQGPAGAWGGYCRNEPYIVLGAEKHDAGAAEGNPAAYPSFNGWLDELRLSTTLRYTGSFTVPRAPFVADAATAGLYHFDEGPAGPCTGTLRNSAAGASTSSDGACFYGGSGSAGPEFSSQSPFAGSIILPTSTATAIAPTATATVAPPTATSTSTLAPPTLTATATAIPATATSTATPAPPTATRTNTPIPPTATSTPTNTPVPPTATSMPTATATSLPPTATPSPAANYALAFDGVDDVVIARPVTHGGVLTVEFWVRPASSSMEAIIVNQADDNNGWSVELNDGRPSFWVATTRGWEVVRHSTRLAGGTWYHVAATYNNGAARVFVNGQPGTASTLQSGVSVAGNLRFGGIAGFGRFAGALDDVRVSQAVRYTGAFVAPSRLPAPDSNTLGQWAFNEGSGQVTADGSAAANRGQLGVTATTDAADPAWVSVVR
ncbi:MAG TPA: LamG domain-containing protein [Caldilinea sp.]|nr:LamG domain-containing protein [Caldilinea sp.]